VKCIRVIDEGPNDGQIKRVDNEIAASLVRRKVAEYCPKSEWKKIRPIPASFLKKDKDKKKDRKGK
jgi:hypothetical protein